MAGLEALKEFKGNNNTILVGRAMGKQHYLDCLQTMEKELKALEIIKKLFNPKEYNFLELYENPFITIGEKGEKYRIDSTDDSYIHIGIPKEEFELLKAVLENE